MYISEQLGVDKRFFIDSLINDKVTVRIINKNTSDLLESWLLMLSEKAEKETFNYIKNYK